MANIYRLPILTSTTTFDEIWIRLYDGFVNSVVAANDGDAIASVPQVRNGNPVDSEHAAYMVAMDAVVDGDAIVKYIFEQSPEASDAYAKADVPVKWKYLLQYDSFDVDVESAVTQSADNAYQELTFYQYNDASNVATPVPTYTDGDLDTLIDDMEAAGWYISAGDAYTNKGDNTDLRLAIVSYEYIGATDTSTVNVKVLPEDDIRYSTDNGQTFTEDAPSDPDDITNLEITIGGETVDFLIKPETELVNPVEQIINDVFPPYYYSYSSPYAASLASAVLSDFFGIQFRHWKGESWSRTQDPQHGGITPVIPIDEIRITPPHLLGQDALSGHDDKIEGNVGYYLMIITKEAGENRGEIQFVQVNSDNVSDYSNTRYTTLLCCFESYPNTELAVVMPHLTTQTVITIKGTGRGMSPNDILFIEDEQVRVSSVAAPTVGTDGVFAAITVDRARNGTSSSVHAIDTQVRGIINSDRIRNLSFLAERGLLRPHTIRILGYKRPKELVD